MSIRETNPLLRALRDIRASGRMALCGYFLAGYPTPDEFFATVRAARDLDVVEFGIPSDEPIMDGPVIARAHGVVTEQRGIHAEPALALIGGLRDTPQPRFVMTYSAVGRALDGFLRMCVENGIHGVLAPDADMTEGRFIADKARTLGLASITLLDARADDATLHNCVEIGDLIYVKASAGATGQSADIAGELHDLLAGIIARVRALDADIPIAVGIGIQRPEQVASLADLDVDMVIVGTRIVEHVDTGREGLVDYVRTLRSATVYRQPTAIRRPLWLAFDVGTTGLKAALMQADGTILRSAQSGYTTHTDSGGVVEQNAADWWRAAVATCRDLLGSDGARIGGIALTGQMQDVILLDADGESTGPIILYSDTRAQAEAADVNAAVGSERLRALTGNEQDASSLLAKLLWLQRHDPHALRAARHLLLGAADVLAYRLTGRAMVDTTTASTTGLMDLAALGPLDRSLWDAVGIGAVYDLLPPITPGGALAGALSAQAAEALGLTPGIPVYHGPGDAGSTTLGAGAGEIGHAYGYLGTSGWVAFSASERSRSDGAWTLAHPRGGRYIQVAPLLTAGGNLEWVRDLFERDDYETLIAQALARPSGDLLYLPYLNGERSPFRDPNARGAFVGLSASTERADLYRAVLEGVALAYRHALDALVDAPVERLTMTGGGTRSLDWCRLFADVLRIPIDVAAEAEFVGVRGALLAAQVGAGKVDHYRPAALRTRATLEPSGDALYDRKYRAFRDLYPALRPFFHRHDS